MSGTAGGQLRGQRLETAESEGKSCRILGGCSQLPPKLSWVLRQESRALSQLARGIILIL